MKIRQTLTIMAMVCAVVCAEAQNGFNVPLSQFGIGLSDQPYNNPIVTRMGGTAYTLTGNNFVNPFNPASYAGIESESFVFDMGLGIQMGTLRHDNDHLWDADGNIAYLTVAMPITRWWKLAGGLLPYSSADYESVAQGSYMDSNVVKTVYDGTGGVNQVFLGSAFNLIGNGREGRRLQGGFNVNYLVGNVQRAISYSFQGNDSTYYINVRRYKKTSLSNVLFDLGAQYFEPLGEHYTLGIGVNYKPARQMHVKDLALKYTYHPSDETLVDTIFPARGEDAEYQSDLLLDHTIGVGVSLEHNGRWMVAADATFAGWSGLKYIENSDHPIFGETALQYGPYSRYALGFERRGDMDAPRYLGRISWSLGVHRELGTMYLTIDDTQRQINEWGAGLGVTLPMRKGRSLLTISLGYSQLGTRDILQRNSLTVGISVSSCERWFFKRKFD